MLNHINMSTARGEFDLIDWIRRHAPNAGGGAVTLGIGDDCAGLRFSDGREVAVTTDMLMDGRHFRASDGDGVLEQIGQKALRVNLSDLAAMAAVPVAVVIAVALPKRLGRLDSRSIGQRLHAGIREAAEEFGVSLAGGDTNAWDGTLVISVTALGEATERGLVRRSGALVGDSIFVTGRLGGSLAGRHLRPTPRVREAMALHGYVDLHAMIDLSDGLSGDLRHILEESGRGSTPDAIGALLHAERVPIHDDAIAASAVDGRSPLEHALRDGEDFELCFTVSALDAERLREVPPKFVELSEIGVVTGEPGLRMQHSDRRIETLAARGFDHFADGDAG